MFKFIRRISGTVFPRNDRPWDDDATSNAPRVGQKRRLSTPDEEESATISRKKARSEQATPAPEEPAESVSDVADAQRDSSPSVTADTNAKAEQEVKEVTKGVEEVELEAKETTEEDIATTSTTEPATTEETQAAPTAEAEAAVVPEAEAEKKGEQPAAEAASSVVEDASAPQTSTDGPTSDDITPAVPSVATEPTLPLSGSKPTKAKRDRSPAKKKAASSDASKPTSSPSKANKTE